LTESYQGILQSDGYAAYAAYARNHPGVEWLMCWAHARRKFFDAQRENAHAVRVVLKLIGRMYRLEREWDEAAIANDERARRRQSGFARSLKWLHAVALTLRSQILPQSDLGKACDYLLGHWEPLTAHIRHGHTKLDTNLVENVTPSSALHSLFRGRDHAEMRKRRAMDYDGPARKTRRATRHDRRADCRRTCGLLLAVILRKCAGLYTGRGPRVTYVFPAGHHDIPEADDGRLGPHRGWIHGLSAPTAHRAVYDRPLPPVSQTGSGISHSTRTLCIEAVPA